MAVSILPQLGQFFDNNGDPLNGGTVTVYDAGTTTPRAIYTDTALSVAATNPAPLDSAGRPTQGVLYTAATAYKLLLKDSGGSTLRTEDNLDPGVPLGSGVLAIANGGTGGDTAAAARAALGAVGTADIEDLEAEVASLAGAAASTEKTQIATGSTAQRPTVPEDGQIRRNNQSGSEKWEGYNEADTRWDTFLTDNNAATAADVAAQTSGATLVVTPSVIKNHPAVAAAYGKVTVSGGTPTLAAGYNVSGTITDNGAGDFTFTFTNAMANANYVVVGTAHSTTITRVVQVHTATTTTVRLLVATDGGAAADNIDFSFMVFGVLA
jgi:hypothetical protein